MTRESSSVFKTPARRLTALLICRLYAILPCVVSALIMGVLAALPGGALWGLVLVVGSFMMMALLFDDFLERPATMILNAIVFGLVIVLPAIILPFSGFAGFVGGALLGAFLSAAVVAWGPRLPVLGPRLQAELFPDIFTGLFLVVIFGLPLRLLRAPRGAMKAEASAPFEVAVILCAYQEEATIDRSLASIRVAVERAQSSPLVRRVRVVLVDSSPEDTTRKRLATSVDRVIEGATGKLSARHQATLTESPDIVVAADADRSYDPDWLLNLLAPFADAEVAATMGETRNAGAGMSASALSRSILKLPYNGGNSAYRRAAYLASPFDLTLDQRRHKELWLEEEFLFGLTLQAQGRVVHVPACRSYELRPYPLLAQLSRHLFGVRLRTF